MRFAKLRQFGFSILRSPTPQVLLEHLSIPSDLLDHVLQLSDSRESFFAKTIPFFQRLLLEERTTLFPNGVPLLITNERVELSKRQCAFLIGCAFFNIFDASLGPLDYPKGVGFNIFTFALLWRRGMTAPLACIFNYMTRIALEDHLHNDAVIFTRRVLPKSIGIEASNVMCEIKTSSTIPIEQCHSSPLQ